MPRLDSSFSANCISLVIHRRVGEGRSGNGAKRQSIHDETKLSWSTISCCTVWQGRLMTAYLKEVDGCILDVGAGFRQTNCLQCLEVFTPVKLIMTFVSDGAAI